MLLYRLTYWPDGKIEPERRDLAALDPGAVAQFEPLFDQGLAFNKSTSCELGDVHVKWTGSESGQALLTCSLNQDIFLSGVVLAGIDLEGDQEVLAMFMNSIERLPIVQALASGRADFFGPLRACKERPLPASVVIPALKPEHWDVLAGVDLLATAVFLRRLQA
ncbi:MAG: hypothetical protein AB7K24_15095 [Gemmataceae bacterium]